MALTLSGNGTAADSTYTLGMNSAVGFKNRIINGDMRIDQRNAGSAVTIGAAANTYTLDRWYGYSEQASKFSVQQVSTTTTGFTHRMKVTSLSAYSVLATDTFHIGQKIEGVNVADLGWGTANAKSITISFVVNSSLTGTFGGSVTNSALDRSYPFSYTVNSANTDETKTVTIAGDTSGTWLKDTGTGLRLHFGLGAGSNFSGTAGAWASAWYSTCTGATSVVGTNAATFYITGVQLEPGTQATAFERRAYGHELMLCQRYYQKYGGDDAYSAVCPVGIAAGSTNMKGIFVFPVQMRGKPAVSYNALELADTVSAYAVTSVNLTGSEQSKVAANINFDVAAGLTQYRTYWARASNSTSGYLAFSAEL